MPTVLGERAAAAAAARPRAASPWLAVAAALALAYLPTYWGLAHGLWRDDEYAHGPIVAAVFAWLVWRDRDALAAPRGTPAPFAGGALVFLGLALYAVGRSQSIVLFEVSSHLPLLAGLALLAGGWPLLRRFGFALVFLAFLVPLPGFVMTAATAPLKAIVSTAVAAILQVAGYPVARSGVVLDVGGHPLLIADACAGLNSITALFAMALLYAHLSGGVLCRRGLLLLAAVVPIAVAANVLRVLVLALGVYYFGDGVVDGWLHGAAGMLVFGAAFALLAGFDRLLGSGKRDSLPGPLPLNRPNKLGTPGERERFSASAGALIGAAIAIGGVALATPSLAPQPMARPIDLAAILPASFGDWRLDRDVPPIAPTPDARAKLDRLYDAIAARTYVNSAGERMMLTVAYGGDQSDALKAHRQEVCYTAQGFRVGGLEHATLAAAGREIPVTRFIAVRGARSEPVTYWFTMGDRVVLGRLERLRVQLAAGFAGRIPDGMLVRVSSLSHDPRAAYVAQQGFVQGLLAAIPESTVVRLAGARA
jgi:exosortase B